MSTDSTNKKSRHFNKKTLFLLILGSIFVVTIIGILIGSAVQKNNESKFNLDSAISQVLRCLKTTTVRLLNWRIN